jgi:hypothetical protein
MRAFTLRALVLSVATVGFGCSGEIDNLPTTPDPVIVTDTFTGTININGAATHNVFTTATGTVTARLTSLGDNPPARIGLALGTLASGGTVCNIVVANDNAVVTTEIVGSVQSLAGSLCARIYDVGSLTESVSYTFTVTHP